MAAQNLAVARSKCDVVAFSDANATWAPDALRLLVRAFADPEVAYVCGRLVLEDADGTNVEGAYWRLETLLREQESETGSITGGNGSIYAVRRSDYVDVDTRFGHDLSFPYLMVQRGRRAVYDPAAFAFEKPTPDVEDEYRRKVRMFEHGWLMLHKGRMLENLPPGLRRSSTRCSADHARLGRARPRPRRRAPWRLARQPRGADAHRLGARHRLARATGEYVAFLDAADEWVPDRLARLVAMAAPSSPTGSRAPGATASRVVLPDAAWDVEPRPARGPAQALRGRRRDRPGCRRRVAARLPAARGTEVEPVEEVGVRRSSRTAGARSDRGPATGATPCSTGTSSTGPRSRPGRRRPD